MSELQGLAELTLPGDARELVSRLSDYFGPWLIEPTRGMAMWNAADKMNFREHVSESRSLPQSAVSYFGESGMMSRDDVANTDGKVVAVLDIAGTMMKSASSMSSNTGTIRVRHELRAAMNDPKIGAALIRFDTPGGTVAGTADLAGDIAFAATQKPVVGFAEDLVASAGLWCFTQCLSCYANAATAQIGSIGTVLGLYDQSGAAAQAGIKALVFATGPLKGAGFPGAEITDAQKAYFQSIVDEIQPSFTQAVAMGRKLTLTHVQALATGAVFSATKAKEHGLIDGIQSFDQTLNQLFQMIPAGGKSSAKTKRGSQMKDTNSAADSAAETASVEPTADQMRASITADLTKFVAKFGAENGAKWFTESKSYEQALEAHVAVLEAKLAADREASDKLVQEADAKIATLEAALKDVKLGETAAVSFQDGDKGSKGAAKSRNVLGDNLSVLASEIEGKLTGANASA